MLKILKEIQNFTQQNDVYFDDNEDMKLFNAMLSCQTRKKQFVRFLKGKGSEFKHLKIIGDYEACKFGNWINGPGKEKFGDTKEWKLLAEAHANSHLLLHEIKKLYSEGQSDLALELVNGPYKDLEVMIQKLGATLHRKLLMSQKKVG